MNKCLFAFLSLIQAHFEKHTPQTQLLSSQIQLLLIFTNEWKNQRMGPQQHHPGLKVIISMATRANSIRLVIVWALICQVQIIQLATIAQTINFLQMLMPIITIITASMGLVTNLKINKIVRLIHHLLNHATNHVCFSKLFYLGRILSFLKLA